MWPLVHRVTELHVDVSGTVSSIECQVEYLFIFFKWRSFEVLSWEFTSGGYCFLLGDLSAFHHSMESISSFSPAPQDNTGYPAGIHDPQTHVIWYQVTSSLPQPRALNIPQIG